MKPCRSHCASGVSVRRVAAYRVVAAQRHFRPQPAFFQLPRQGLAQPGRTRRPPIDLLRRPLWRGTRPLQRRARRPNPRHLAAYRVVAQVRSLVRRATYRVVARVPSLTLCPGWRAAYRVVARTPSLALCPHRRAAYRVVARPPGSSHRAHRRAAYRVVAHLPHLPPRRAHRPLQPARRRDRRPPRRLRRRLGPHRQPLDHTAAQHHRRTVRHPDAHPKPSPRRARPPAQTKPHRNTGATRHRTPRLERHLRGVLRRPQLLRRRVQPRRHPGRQIRLQQRRIVRQRNPRAQRPHEPLRQPLRRPAHREPPMRRLRGDHPRQPGRRARPGARPAMDPAPSVRHRQPAARTTGPRPSPARRSPPRGRVQPRPSRRHARLDARAHVTPRDPGRSVVPRSAVGASTSAVPAAATGCASLSRVTAPDTTVAPAPAGQRSTDQPSPAPA